MKGVLAISAVAAGFEGRGGGDCQSGGQREESDQEAGDCDHVGVVCDE